MMVVVITPFELLMVNAFPMFPAMISNVTSSYVDEQPLPGYHPTYIQYEPHQAHPNPTYNL